MHPVNMEEFADTAKACVLAGDRDPELSHSYLDTLMQDALEAIGEDFTDSLARIKVATVLDLMRRADEWRRWYA